MSRGFLTSGDYLFLEKLGESRGVTFPSQPAAGDKPVSEARAGLWFGRGSEPVPRNDYNSEYKAQFDETAKKEAVRQQIASVAPVYRLKRFK